VRGKGRSAGRGIELKREEKGAAGPGLIRADRRVEKSLLVGGDQKERKRLSREHWKISRGGGAREKDLGEGEKAGNKGESSGTGEQQGLETSIAQRRAERGKSPRNTDPMGQKKKSQGLFSTKKRRKRGIWGGTCRGKNSRGIFIQRKRRGVEIVVGAKGWGAPPKRKKI